MGLRRTPSEITRDFYLIKEVAQEVTTLKELSERVGLSVQQIYYTLNQTPGEYEKVKALLKANEKKKINTSSNNSTIEKKSVHTTDSKKDNVQRADSEDNSQQNTTTTATTNAEVTIINPKKKFVIDTSICRVPSIVTDIQHLISEGHKIVITSVNLLEFDSLQHRQTEPDSALARRILSLAANTPEKFEIIEIEDNVGIPDDCIIKYCKEHRDEVALITSDKVMALKARMLPNYVETIYREHVVDKNNTTPQPASTPITTNTFIITRLLKLTKQVNGKLNFVQFKDQKTSIRIISDTEHYIKYPYEVRISDLILVATLNNDRSIDFKVFRINSVVDPNKWEVIFTTHCDDPKYSLLPKPEYNLFLHEFRKDHPISVTN